MRNILSSNFFNRDTVRVARELLGKYLVRRRRGSMRAYMITEVEAYDGTRDKGSHASRGKTARNALMFGPPGCWYVYFTYGMHWMLNVTTREKGYPGAVLIRGIEGASGPAPLEKSRPKAAHAVRRRKEHFPTGPARLTKKLGIRGELNGKPATRTSGLWVEDRGVHVRKMQKGPRIGIPYAGRHWALRHLRFWIGG